eukprot:1147374-Pelagomonas_calceolata.AAC.12
MLPSLNLYPYGAMLLRVSALQNAQCCQVSAYTLVVQCYPQVARGCESSMPGFCMCCHVISRRPLHVLKYDVLQFLSLQGLLGLIRLAQGLGHASLALGLAALPKDRGCGSAAAGSRDEGQALPPRLATCGLGYCGLCVQDGLHKLGEDADTDEINNIMSQADKNGDGTIDYEEFCIM